MSFDEYYQLGNIIKTHGLRGEVIFFLDVDDPEEYQELESVFIDLNGKLIPFFIESFHLQGDRAIVALEEVENIEDAEPLVGKSTYLPLDSLPKLPEGKYYYHQLIGCAVYEGEKLIGPVTEVFEMPTNYLIGVDHQGKEVLIPIADEIVRSVDLQAQKIAVHLPEGLLALYLEP